MCARSEFCCTSHLGISLLSYGAGLRRVLQQWNETLEKSTAPPGKTAKLDYSTVNIDIERIPSLNPFLALFAFDHLLRIQSFSTNKTIRKIVPLFRIFTVLRMMGKGVRILFIAVALACGFMVLRPDYTVLRLSSGHGWIKIVTTRATWHDYVNARSTNQRYYYLWGTAPF